MYRNTLDSYGIVARVLHWLIFLLVASVLIAAAIFDEMGSGPLKSTIVGLHKSIGVTILFVIVLRLLWRLTNPRPRDLGQNALQNTLAHLMHFLLYLLLIAQPLVGIVMSQSLGYPVKVFGLFQLPMWIAKNQQLGNWLSEVHEGLATALMVAVALHAAAALWHHFIEKDRTLMRMLVGS